MIKFWSQLLQARGSTGYIEKKIINTYFFVLKKNHKLTSRVMEELL